MASAIKNLYEAKTELSALVERAAKGEEIVIAKNGVAMAKLVPLDASRAERKPGDWHGRVWIADDFDDPLPESVAASFERPLLPKRQPTEKPAGRKKVRRAKKT